MVCFASSDLTRRLDESGEFQWGLKERGWQHLDADQDDQGNQKCQDGSLLPVVYTEPKGLSAKGLLGCVRCGFLCIHLGLVITRLLHPEEMHCINRVIIAKNAHKRHVL